MQELLQNLVEQSGPELSPGEQELFHQLLLSYADALKAPLLILGGQTNCNIVSTLPG